MEQSEASGVYRLTLKTAGLSRRDSERLRLVQVSRPHLVRLREELDESVALAERRSQSVVLIDVLETTHPLRLSFQIGDDCPFLATALGKAVAAHLSPVDLALFVQHSTRPTYPERTKTKVRQLRAELAQTRRYGYAINDEETLAGALLLGAPLFDREGCVCGALSVNTPTARCPVKLRQVLIAAAVSAGRRISEDLAVAGFVSQRTN